MRKRLFLAVAAALACGTAAARQSLPLNPLWHGTWVNVDDPRETMVVTRDRFTIQDRDRKARDFQWIGNRGEFERSLESKQKNTNSRRAEPKAAIRYFSGYSIFNGQPMTINVPVSFGAQLEAARQSGGQTDAAGLVATVQRAEQAMNSLKPGTYRMIGLVDARKRDSDCDVVASLITDGKRLYREWPCESAGLDMFAASRVYHRKP